MSLTKDGFYKSFSGVIGNNNYLLEAGGGHIAWGNAANQIPYSNGTVNTSLNADMTDGLHVHTGRNNEANKIVRTDGSGYIQAGYINSSSGDENNNSSPNRVWGTNGSDSYLRTYRTSALNVGSSTNLNRVSGGFTTGGAGWFKLASIKSTDARGVFRISIYTTGGNWIPEYCELMIRNGWSIIDFIQYGQSSYIDGYRYTVDDTYSYVEAHFTGNTTFSTLKFSGVGYVNDNNYGWSLYTSAVAGSGTVQGSEYTKTTTSNKLFINGLIEGSGFVKTGSSNSYVLLGGGGHKDLSDFSMAHSHPYLPLSGGWMDWNAQISFKGYNGSTSVYSRIGYSTSASGQTMHCSNSYQNNGALYITSNGSTSNNDTGGLAIDNEGVTVFGAGDAGSNFTGVFRVLNEDNVADGPQFIVTKSSGATTKYSHSAQRFISTISTGTQPYSCSSTTCNTNLNADLLDGYHASGLFTNFGNSGNNITATIGGTTKTFTVNYANSAGSATNASWLTPQSNFHTGRALGYAQTSNGPLNGSNTTGTPTSWSHYILMSHNNGQTYYHYQLAFPFWGPPMYQRKTGGSTTSENQSVWYTFITTENGYWANQPIQTSSSTSTNPQFNSVNVGGTSTGYGAYLASGKRLYIEGTESNAIYTEHHSNGHISTNSPESNAAIRHGFVFKWYDTYWKIGNVRGGGTNSAGFGIADSGGARLGLLVRPDLCGTNIYGKTANRDSNAALRVIKGWDCGNRAGYDTVVISSNDCTSLRLIESDGTSTGISAGDNKSILATTHNFQFYSGCSNTGTIYNGMGGTFRFGINYSNFDAWVQRGLRVNASGSYWTHDPSSSNSGVCIFADSNSMNTYIHMKPSSHSNFWGLATYYESGSFGYASNLLVYQAPTSGTNAVNNCYIFRGISYGGQGQSYVATCEGNVCNIVCLGVFDLYKSSNNSSSWNTIRIAGMFNYTQIYNNNSDNGSPIYVYVYSNYSSNYSCKRTPRIVSAIPVIQTRWYNNKVRVINWETQDSAPTGVECCVMNNSSFGSNLSTYSVADGTFTGQYIAITAPRPYGYDDDNSGLSMNGMRESGNTRIQRIRITLFGYMY